MNIKRIGNDLIHTVLESVAKITHSAQLAEIGAVRLTVQTPGEILNVPGPELLQSRGSVPIETERKAVLHATGLQSHQC